MSKKVKKMDLGMTQGSGDAEQPGMPPERTENKVSIEKMPDGSYQVEMAVHDESMIENESAEAAQSFRTAMEACQAAISMLEDGGNAEAEIMDGYNGPSKQMKKVGVKEVFGG